MFQRPIIYIIIWGLVFSIGLFSQNEDLIFFFQKINLENGLTDNRYNNFIFQDSRGFTWISSIDGLNRFDGEEIKTYRQESGMLDTNIQSDFFEDSKGNIWFSTYEAINCYVWKEDSIQTFQVKDSLDNPIVKDYKVFHLDLLKDRLWLKAGEQIYGINIQNPQSYFVLPTYISAFNFNVCYNKEGDINKIIATPWLYGNGVDFIYIDDSLLLKHEKYLSDIPHLKNAVYMEDSIWLFSEANQFFLFDESKPKVVRKLNNSQGYDIWDFVKVNEDELLISTKFNGLCLYNWRTEEFLYQWVNNLENRFSLSSNKPRELHLINNYLWVSHANKGVDYTYLYGNNFSNPFEDYLSEKVEIVSLLEEENGEILVGTKQNGIYSFAFDDGYTECFSYPLVKSDSSNLWQVLNFQNDWIATSSNAIYILDKRKMRIKQIIGLNEEVFYRLMAEVFPNRLLISSNRGVKEILKDDDGNYYLTDCLEFSEYPSFDFVQFFQTSTNKLYVPYSTNELWVYKANYEGLKLIKKLKCNLEFFGFCESKKYPNNIWAATSKGLVKIVNDTIIQFVMKEDALLRNTYGVVEDHNGKIWITSNQGLYKYDEEAVENRLFQFNKVDGLSGDFFSIYNSAICSKSGNVWLGNNNGIVKFKPSEIKDQVNNLFVYINEIMINNKKVDTKIVERDSMSLRFDENTLTFDVQTIGLIKSKQNKIKYYLKGYDKAEIIIDNNRQIHYTKIPSGKYSLELTAIGSNGRESPVKKITIHIAPAFWQTWWFYLLSASLFAMLIYGVYRYRLAQLIKEEEKKTAFAQLETQLVEVEMKALRAQMNPHFLFNAMNSIKGIIIRKEEKKAADYLTKFSSLLRGILANSEKQKIILSKEIEVLRLYIELESLRFTQDFNYQIQIDKEIDTGFTRIPPLVLQPFVENAIWHGLIPKTEGTNKLSINVFREEDFILLEVEDNGVGRKESAKIRKTKKQKSMGIGITKKRIEMLHEENEVKIIDLVDANGKAFGTKVVVKLFAPE